MRSAMALIGAYVNNDIVDTDIHRRSRRPNKPMVPRQIDPSPRSHRGSHVSNENDIIQQLQDNDESVLSPGHIMNLKICAVPTISQSVDAADIPPFPSIHPAKVSYISRVMSFGGETLRGVGEKDEVAKQKEALATTSAKGPIADFVNNTKAAFMSFRSVSLRSHHNPTSAIQSTPSSPRQQGSRFKPQSALTQSTPTSPLRRPVDVTSPTTAPTSSQISRQLSRKNSFQKSRPSSPQQSRYASPLVVRTNATGVATIVPPLVLGFALASSPLYLSTLAEVAESSLLSDSGQVLSSLSDMSVQSSLKSTSTSVVGPCTGSMPIPTPVPETSPPTITAAAGPSLRELLQIGFALSPRDMPRDNGNDDNNGKTEAGPVAVSAEQATATSTRIMVAAS